MDQVEFSRAQGAGIIAKGDFLGLTKSILKVDSCAHSRLLLPVPGIETGETACKDCCWH